MDCNISVKQPQQERYTIKISAQNQWEDYAAHLDYISKNEVWWPIKDFEDLYEVSSFGRVKILRALRGYYPNGNPRIIEERIIERKSKRDDYHSIAMWKDGKRQPSRKVHQLVGETFMIPPPPGFEIDHKDENKLNNHISNLEYVTHRENVVRAFKSGLNWSVAENHVKAKISNQDAIDIVNSNLPTKELSKKYGLVPSMIIAIKKGRYWSTITGVQYKNERLSKEEVLEIFNSSLSYRKLAKKYDVTVSNIMMIKTGRTHSKITGKKYAK